MLVKGTDDQSVFPPNLLFAHRINLELARGDLWVNDLFETNYDMHFSPCLSEFTFLQSSKGGTEKKLLSQFPPFPLYLSVGNMLRRRRSYTQSKVRVTALSHPLWSLARVSASIAGSQVLSMPQFARISSVFAQKPTARPAA